MGYWIIKLLFGPVIKLIWVRKTEGLENLPRRGACIVAANHSSYFDFISLVAVLPRRICFLAAEKFYKSTFWRPIMRLTGQIKVERSDKDKTEVYRKAREALKKGRVIGIFPEGTRSPSGEIQKTYTGVAKFALENKVPVIPIGIKGTFEIMSRYDKSPKLKKEIEINIGRPLFFEEYHNKEKNEDVYRQVTDIVMGEIMKLSGKQ
jgi:1-acyl-sn-glycerol-3-phosphate acyltransferase